VDHDGVGRTAHDVVDFNGDGLPDLLDASDQNLDCSVDADGDGQPDDSDGDGLLDGLAGCTKVFFNTGQGFAAEPVYVQTPLYGSYKSAIRLWQFNGETYLDLFDVNGDGLPDSVYRVYGPIDGEWVDYWQVALNEGSNLEPFAGIPGVGPYGVALGLGPRRWPGASGPIRKTSNGLTRIDILDFNGDGMLDYVAIEDGVWTVRLNANPYRPNLLVTMLNGLGGQTDVVYEPSTLSDNTGGDHLPDLPFSTWVVTSLRETDGLCDPGNVNVFDPEANACIPQGHERQSQIQYADGRFEVLPGEREFRGFRTVYRIDLDGNATLTTFGQDAPTKGKVLEVDTYAGNPEGPSGAYPVRLDINYWDTIPFPGSQADRSQVWLGATDRITYDLATTFPHVLETVNEQPDEFGNVPHTKTFGLFETHRVDSYTDYAVPASGTPTYGGPVRNRPSHTRSEGAVGPATEQWFFYDGRTDASVEEGNLTRVESWLDTVTGPGAVACGADGSKQCVPVNHTYDDYGNIETIEDARHAITTTQYDERSLHPFLVTNALGHNTQTEIDYRWGKPKTVIDSNDVHTEYQYDELGRLKCVARPGDSLTWDDCSERYTYTYGVPGEYSTVLVERKEPSNRAQAESGDPDGVPGYVRSTEHFDALGRHRYITTYRVVDGQGQVIVGDKVEYDVGGRVSLRYYPYPENEPSSNGSTSFDYHLNGHPDYIDPLGRVHTVTNVDGTTRTTSYDPYVTTTVDEEGNQTANTVDCYGRVTETQVYVGGSVYASTQNTYDAADRLLTRTQNGNANTRITNTYDSLGRKIRITDPDSGLWEYDYDAVGNLIFQNDPQAGQHVEFCYDLLNRVKRQYYFDDDAPHGRHDCASTTEPQIRYTYDEGSYGIGRLHLVEDLSGSTSFTYDSRGRTTSTTKTIIVDGAPTTATTWFEYDAADHLIRTWYPDQEAVTTGYDDAGQPDALYSAERSYVASMTYDLVGRMRQLTHGNGVIDAREYYGAPGPALPDPHRLSRITTAGPGGTYLDVKYESYTPRGFLEDVEDQRDAQYGDSRLSNTAVFTYDSLGRLIAMNRPSALDVFGYNTFGNITQKEGKVIHYDDPARPHRATSVCIMGGACTDLSHDSNGNRTGKDGGAQTYEFTHDDHLETLTANSETVNFLYDYTGRRVAKIADGGSTVTRYYSELAEATNDGYLTKFYFIGGVRLAAQRTDAAYQFAAVEMGPITVASVWAGRPVLALLVRSDVQRGAAIAMVLIAFGLIAAPWRRRPVVGIAVRHGHVIGVVIAFTLGTLPWPLIFLPSAAVADTPTPTPRLRCVAHTPTPRPPEVWHYHQDYLGSTQVVTTAEGLIQEQIRYRAYGEIRGRWNRYNAEISSPDANRRYEFTGYETELTSGLEYAGARFYDPVLGSFLTHDPARQFANPYSYTGWNPVNAVDPGGEISGFVAALIIIGAVATASAIDVGVRTGDAGSAFEAFGAAVFFGISTLPLPIVAQAALPAPVFYSIAAAGGAYGTYAAADQGYYATAIVSGALTLWAAYGALKGPEGESIGDSKQTARVARSGSTAQGGSSPGPQFAADSSSLSDANNDIRVDEVIIVTATRLDGLRSPWIDPVDILAGAFAGAFVAGMIRGAAGAGGRALATSAEVRGAQSAATAVRLSKQLASEEGVSEVLTTGGKVIAGRATNVPLRDAGRLASQYGGSAADWVKVTSTAPGHLQTHAYRNLMTGEVVELKSILP